MTGLITVKENQKLTLTYTVTNTKYKIERKWYEKLKDDSKETRDIKITQSLDGKTINASEHIKIVEK